MKFGAKIGALTSSVVLLSVLGVAVAQPVGLGSGTDDAEAKAQSLSPAEMLKLAKEYLPEMEQVAKAVAEQVKKARDDKDVVKALCLGDKHGQVDLATKTAVDRLAGLESAINQNDLHRARHQFTVLSVLHERAGILLGEAQQCIGEETGFIGETDVTVEIDPTIPETDPSEFPEPALLSAPPATSSPTF